MDAVWGSDGDRRLHPIVWEASRGVLPEWARASDVRVEHMARVAELMSDWARRRGEPEDEIARWTSVAYLHDAMRDADPEEMRTLVDARFAVLPDKILHGPASAALLKRSGVEDREIIQAVELHTLGSAGFRDLGRALYAADFLEPGRTMRDEWRAGLRERLPQELDQVVREILGMRIGFLVERGRPLRPETAEFWNSMIEGSA